MTDHIADLKAAAQRHTGTFGPACMTCAFRSPKKTYFYDWYCHKYGMGAGSSRARESLCGPEGRSWEPRPPRLGLIPWLRRLLWGDP